MTLQQEVIKKLRCKPEINVKEEIRLTINFLKDFLKIRFDMIILQHYPSYYNTQYSIS